MRASNGCGWSRSGTLPTGNNFLPDTNTQILLEMIAACPPGKVRDILRACYERKINASIRRIRDLLMRPYSTVREWLWRVHERGLDNISTYRYHTWDFVWEETHGNHIFIQQRERLSKGNNAPDTRRVRCAHFCRCRI